LSNETIAGDGNWGPLRELRPKAQAILDRLLEAEFEGRDEICQQVAESQARTADEDGSLKRITTGEPPVPVRFEAPISGHAWDEDGVGMEIVLRMEGNRVDELEFYKFDGSRVQRLPAPAELELIPLGGVY
jgi:hypothetical protein